MPNEPNSLDLRSEVTKLQMRIDAALETANLYGGIDGDHHKMWVIDQMVRALCGNDEAYDTWVMFHKFDTDDPDLALRRYNVGDYSEWETGVAP